MPEGLTPAFLLSTVNSLLSVTRFTLMDGVKVGLTEVSKQIKV